MPRFVILEHDHPHLHWDFMLEVGEVLWTWRLATPPEGAASRIVATRIGEHRRAYLDYEGQVSGGRGTVKRWDAGTYDAIRIDDTRIEMSLHGQRFTGRAVLRRLDDGAWELGIAAGD